MSNSNYVWERKRGDRGQEVRRAQLALGIPADGIFGPQTEQAVIAYHGSPIIDRCMMYLLGIPIDLGVDVSSYQVDTDWARVSSVGVTFAWRKVTEGQTHVNGEKSSEAGDSVAFIRDAIRARENNIEVGFYHFGRPDTDIGSSDAKAEAQHFLSYVIPDVCSLPYALDVEKGVSGDYNYNANWVINWCEFVEQTTSKPVIIYTARWAFNSYLKHADDKFIQKIIDRPLWLADYDGNPDDEVAPWDEYTINQFTGSGSIDGIKGNCDVNWSAGGALSKLVNGGYC